jgi:hypothetical protein
MEQTVMGLIIIVYHDLQFSYYFQVSNSSKEVRPEPRGSHRLTSHPIHRREVLPQTQPSSRIQIDSENIVAIQHTQSLLANFATHEEEALLMAARPISWEDVIPEVIDGDRGGAGKAVLIDLMSEF